MRRSIVATAAALLALLWMMPAGAATIVRVADAELVAQAPLVVVARLLERSASDAGRPATSYRWAVERVLQGEAGSELTVELPGGRGADGVGLRIDGVPSFQPGERAILFLEPRDGGAHRLLHLMQGAFREVRSGGRSLALRDLVGVVELTPTARGMASAPAAAAEPLRDFDAFAEWIAASARGASPEPTYRVRPSAEGLRGIAAPFRLFTDPFDGLSMRWFEFDSGGTVPWFFGVGGQPGVAGGGQTELLAALEAWEADPQTPIRLDFAGISSATGGLGCDFCFDGLNVVLFGDPNEELSDLGPSCSGTLAYGGPWYSFATLPFGSQSYHPIVEADVVMNDGLECFYAASPDASKAAEELFAHELGHTLGIDHSEFSAALMFPFIHDDGRGAQLHDDDRAAARSLYGAPPPPPPPPEPCVPSPTVACLLDGRIQAELTWVNDPPNPRTPPTWPSGGEGLVALDDLASDKFAFFSLHDDETLEVMLEVIDASAFSGWIWVFWTALTDAGFELRLTDTVTGATKSYEKAQGTLGDARADTQAFPSAPGAPTAGPTARVAPAAVAGASGCGPTTLCLHEGRFEISVHWLNHHSFPQSEGTAGAIPYSESSGLFWFFDEDSPTFVVNLVDARSWGEGFWVHAGGLTDLQWTLTILDTATGATWSHRNPPGSLLPLLHLGPFPPPLEQVVEVPTLGDAGMAALALLLLTGGCWMLRRTG